MTKEELQALANLARLDLTEEELKKLHREMDSILGYVNRLQNIETAGVMEGSMVEETFLRSDEAAPVDHATREVMISNFPQRVGDALSVPAVFENPKG